ncbi:hypothetical protein [Chitinilyticum aquatile]|uniref:hypothetical protein n=1 Tax=Chitinilyticum aquatile TaxID=362520 RepID=UPI00042A3AB5|nr:hypothetical protein [Chitinilyticum aquatile]
MNPKLLSDQELVLIEMQTDVMLEAAKPQSQLYQTAYRLRLYLQLEQIRRGLFGRQVVKLRHGMRASG